MTPLPRASARRHLSLLVAASLVAGAGLVGLASPVEPASAAPVDATAGSLSWGIDADYRATFANYRTATAPASFVDDRATFPLTSGSWDDASQQGELAFGGTARIGYVLGSDAQVGTAQGNYVHLGSPTVSISGGVATISGTTAGSSHDLNPALPTAAKATRTFATVDLSAVQAVSTPTSITWTAAPAAITAQGAQVLALLAGSDASQTPQVRATGSSLDPVTITVDRTLAAEPEPTPEPSTPTEPEPTPEPSTPDPTTPAEPTTTLDTTTKVAAVTPAPVVAPAHSTFTATVAADGTSTPTGTVAFSATPAGSTTPVDLGSAPLVDGTATLTTPLAPGGHAISAAYAGGTSGSTAFRASSAQLTGTGQGATSAANWSVVDASQPTACTPGSSAVSTSDDVTARWGWSAYSSGWTKTAGGGISLAEDGQTFALTGGTATGDADCVVVDFTGTMKVAAYASFFPPAGQWVELVDPSLTIASDGTGTWSAGVRTGVGAENSSAPVETVVAAATGASFPDLAADGELTAPLAYEGTTAQGTWSRDFDDAWSNAFVLQVPSAVRAFYYTSGTTAANATKPPSPVMLAWGAAPVTTPEPETPGGETPDPGTVPEIGQGNLAWGFKDSWRGYLATIAAGTTAVSGGATIAPDGRFVFDQVDGGDFDPATGLGTIRYTGAVLFTSASHGFSIGFADPWVTTTADGGSVLTARTSTSDTAGLDSTERIELVRLATSTAVPGAAAAASAGGAPAVSLLAALDAAAAPTDRWDAVAGTFSDSLSPAGWELYRGQAADPVSFGFRTAVAEPGGETPIVAPLPGGGVGAGSGNGTGTGVAPAGTGTATGTAAGQDRCVARAVSGATLSWGVKESYRSYITGPIAKGAVSLDGVTTTSGGAYAWSGGSGSVNTEAGRGSVAWGGGVHFTGHGGTLDMTISAPRVQLVSGSQARLVVDMTSKPMAGGAAVTTKGLALANLALGQGSRTATDGTLGWSGVPATLTAAGAVAFGEFYDAGEALDPVSFSLPLGATVACDGSTAASGSDLAFTGGGLGLGGLLLGSLLLLTGLGAVAVRRRRAGVLQAAPAASFQAAAAPEVARA
ncbi:HtaA domain-containing protein [Frigoribacterium sp. PvP032]|uniref:HtaA domain-containing protein n=1 Tax=Frigoribacterium sp. PvP032 TaxID=2806589 RepID=UPI001AEA01C1|nr:HtaA domain-containing protein [Frigoribacterium sp. PvP032]MBP1189704.1 hypothetical protein [Frigoribacterium sp. PvP032]